MQSINTTKSIIDWFLGKNDAKQVKLLLLVVIVGLSYWVFRNEQRAIDFQFENKKRDSIINKLNTDNLKLKYNAVIVLDSDKYDPDPSFIVNAETNNVISVNPAYVQKHLMPIGLSASDIIGTDGEHIFGKNMVQKFRQNNAEIIRTGEKRIFRNELNVTVKFPIGEKGFIYAIGGRERLNFN